MPEYVPKQTKPNQKPTHRHSILAWDMYGEANLTIYMNVCDRLACMTGRRASVNLLYISFAQNENVRLAGSIHIPFDHGPPPILHFTLPQLCNCNQNHHQSNQTTFLFSSSLP